MEFYHKALEAIGLMPSVIPALLGGLFAAIFIITLSQYSRATRTEKSVHNLNIILGCSFMCAFFALGTAFMVRYNPSVFQDTTTWGIVGITGISLIAVILLWSSVSFIRHKQWPRLLFALCLLFACISVLTFLIWLGCPIIVTHYPDGAITISATGAGWESASFLARDISVLLAVVAAIAGVFTLCKRSAVRRQESKLEPLTNAEPPKKK